MTRLLPIAGLCVLALLPLDAARAEDCRDDASDCVVVADADTDEALPEDAVAGTGAVADAKADADAPATTPSDDAEATGADADDGDAPQPIPR